MGNNSPDVPSIRIMVLSSHNLLQRERCLQAGHFHLLYYRACKIAIHQNTYKNCIQNHSKIITSVVMDFRGGSERVENSHVYWNISNVVFMKNFKPSTEGYKLSPRFHGVHFFLEV